MIMDNNTQFSLDLCVSWRASRYFPPWNTKLRFLCVTLRAGWLDSPAQSDGAPDHFIIEPFQWLGHAGSLKPGNRGWPLRALTFHRSDVARAAGPWIGWARAEPIWVSPATPACGSWETWTGHCKRSEAIPGWLDCHADQGSARNDSLCFFNL